MKNVTITLEEEVARWARIRARWARIRAAERDTSVSRLVGELLREKMLDEHSYRTSMEAYLSKSPQLIKNGEDPYPDREALHDRSDLR
jgi:hypothetical protein